MTNGRLSINTDFTDSIMSYLNNSISNLNSNVTNGLSSGFQPLTESGLVSESLSKVKSQVKTIVNKEQAILNSISSHVDEVVSGENQLYNEFMNGIGKSSDTSSLQDETYYSPTGGNIDTDEEDDGKKINTNAIVEIIDNLNDEDKKSLLILLEMYKDSDVSLKELLLNNEASEELYKTLCDVFPDNINQEELSLEDTKEVQKKLLDSVINGETSNVELDNNSILVAKEYLSNISSKNNISSSDLLLDESNSDLLKKSLIDLYNGNVDDNATEKQVNNFKNFIDNIASENNMSMEELINNNIELIY